MNLTDPHQPAPPPTVLAIDIGGSHVKIRCSTSKEERRIDSGPDLTAKAMVDGIMALASGWDYDVVSIGYPGVVKNNRILKEPVHLGSGWADFDFAESFGKPVKVVNDALMQAIGSYEGGRMLFLGLGTGLGTALIVDNVCHPLEIGHLPFSKKKSFEDRVSEAARENDGKKKWRKKVREVAERFGVTLLPDYIVIGGGNVKHLDEMPPHCLRGDNTRAFIGGFRIWQDGKLIV